MAASVGHGGDRSQKSRYFLDSYEASHPNENQPQIISSNILHPEVDSPTQDDFYDFFESKQPLAPALTNPDEPDSEAIIL